MKKLPFIALFFFSSIVWASDKTDVIDVYKAWCQSIGTAKGNAQEIVKYYAPGAILLPTISPNILFNTDGGLNAYFTRLTSKKDIRCTPEQLFPRIFGDIAINSGSYVFSYIKEGKAIKIPAYFSFVYQKINNRWMIVNHHSSRLPTE